MKEAAKAIGISLRKFEQLVAADGDIASLKIGRRRLIRPLALKDLVRRLQESP